MHVSRLTAGNRQRAESDHGVDRINLDVSRLLWRALRGRLTGIDRVEHAYGVSLARLASTRLNFVAFDHVGSFRQLPFGAAREFLDAVSAGWQTGTLKAASRIAKRLLINLYLRPPVVDNNDKSRHVYINTSTYPLGCFWSMRRLARSGNIKMIFLMHDIIPLHYPEYVPSFWVHRHKNILRTVGNLASAVIANSRYTADSLKNYIPEHIPVFPIHLGVNIIKSPESKNTRPYFLCIGTVEPRKNHITLLHVWRDLALRFGDAAPRLFIVGRYGWLAEHVVKLITASPSLQSCVVWLPWASDNEVARLLGHAKALLMPSFAEGYGLPVAEALSCGTPVICSDIPTHREIGQGIPEYIHPTDGPGWESVIVDYALTDSPRRALQMERLKDWRAPSWDDHVGRVLDIADGLQRNDVNFQPRTSLGAGLPR